MLLQLHLCASLILPRVWIQTMRRLWFIIVSIFAITLSLLIWISHIHCTNHRINNAPKLPSTSTLPSTISLFDEIAYQKAMEHNGLNETFCSPVLVLKVSKEKGIYVSTKVH